MKVYCVTSAPELDDEQIKKLNKLGDFKIVDAAKLSPAEIIKKIPDAEILIAAPSGIEVISEELLSGLEKLKYITLLTVGYNWVNVDYANKIKIPISNVKGSNAESVAEHIWGIILDLSKRITEFDRDVRQKGAYKFGDYVGKEVLGKTLGIIGLGDIGSRVVRIAQCFNMKILGVRKSGKSIDGVTLTDLESLLKQSDIVCICVPLNDETKDMINVQEINLMKKGAILVNCAREAIVNKTAVIEAIKSGKLFGYGVETEIMKQIPKDDEYLKYPNIIAIPHNAFNTFESRRNSYDMAIENIEAFLKGEPVNLITKF